LNRTQKTYTMIPLEGYSIETKIKIDGKTTTIKSQKKLQPIQLENWMRDTFIEFNAITPINADINIEASLYNGISDTWMCMASYYGNEKRFVKH
jgi:hypothetical protein